MKYFVFGDVHGEYYVMRKELKAVGFDPDNPNHTIISLGDNFDRGGSSREIYNYLSRLPRVVFVKGNHELILEDILDRGFLHHIDIANGCAATIASFAHFSKSQTTFDWDAIAKTRNYPKLRQWLDSMVWYYETPSYIFTHAWLAPSYYLHEDLTKITKAEWQNAVWSRVDKEIALHRNYVSRVGGLKKTICVGHWHTWRLREAFETSTNTVVKNYGIWRDDENKIIALDACTNKSKKINILVIED